MLSLCKSCVVTVGKVVRTVFINQSYSTLTEKPAALVEAFTQKVHIFCTQKSTINFKNFTVVVSRLCTISTVPITTTTLIYKGGEV